MRKVIIYIFASVLLILISCQKDELKEQMPVQGTEIGNEATITFSAMLPSNPDTKAMSNEPTDLESMHLVIFDANGMYVETREATKKSTIVHDEHKYETSFEVTLTVTDQPRIIHFIANCPVEQIVYGHEISIIGNMYTTKSSYAGDDKTLNETAYWARVEVPYILVEQINEGSGIFRPVQGIISSFQCIPLLRNFAQIVVQNSNTNTTFEFIGFTIYNTIDKGTIAPYNNTTQKFQNFIDPETGKGLKYPYLNYKGHALAAADLNTSLERDSSTDDGYKWYTSTTPFYMYERKISVKTDEEEKWSESPPHVIIKGRYNKKIYYYKVDLLYNVYGNTENPNQVTDIVYYNILRNFRYQFTITSVAGEGYTSVEDAVNGATSNNLAGSSTTSKFTNISDKIGRIWVSYTDTTLVTNNQIKFKYKYVPDISKPNETNNDLVADGGLIVLENLFGEVISGAVVEDDDINQGTWLGYRDVTLTINTPDNLTKEQKLVVRTDNPNLTREIRFILKKKYELAVECTPKVEAKIGATVVVDIKLPIGLTEDMFPLDLDIEVFDMTLSPDASKNTIPVVTGPSTIDEKGGVPTFHYVKSIETKAEYDAIPTVGTQKTIKTYWLTNIAANESTVYVSNKYFKEAKDNFVNAKSFANLTINNGNAVREGVGRNVVVTFTMSANDNDFANRNVTVSLTGLANANGDSQFTVKPNAGNRTVTLNLVTTAASGDVSVMIEEESYAAMNETVGRRRGMFNNLSFSEQNLPITAGAEVDFSFTLSDYDPGMSVVVALEGLEPADGSLTTRAVTEYVYSPTSANCTIKLKTTSAGAKTCSVQLSADGYESSETKSIEQLSVKQYNVNRTVSGTLANVTNYDTKYTSFKVQITTADKSYNDATGSITTSTSWYGTTYSYSFKISNWNIEYLSSDQDVIIRLGHVYNKKGSVNYYYGTCTVQDLIDGNITNLVLTKEN